MRAHFDLRSTHLSRRVTWRHLDGPPSWRQRGRPQPVNQAQNLSEQSSGDSDFRELVDCLVLGAVFSSVGEPGYKAWLEN